MKNILLGCVLALAGGCGRVVYVTDARANPLSGAAVTAQYPSNVVSTSYTDADGKATVAAGLADPEALVVAKDGFRKQTLEFPKKWPALIVLDKEKEPTPAPTSRAVVP
jgi:hypothetical protein